MEKDRHAAMCLQSQCWRGRGQQVSRAYWPAFLVKFRTARDSVSMKERKKASKQVRKKGGKERITEGEREEREKGGQEGWREGGKDVRKEERKRVDSS